MGASDFQCFLSSESSSYPPKPFESRLAFGGGVALAEAIAPVVVLAASVCWLSTFARPGGRALRLLTFEVSRDLLD